MKAALIAATVFLLTSPHAGSVQRTLASVTAPSAQPLDTTFPTDSILGNWWSEGKEGLLKIVKTKAGLYEVVMVDGVDADKKDVKNPDPKLRDRTLRGIVIMWHLRFEDGEYVDGYCYNPRDGHTYRVKMKVTGPKSLTLRGYLLVPLLGQSQDWTRAP